jgi:hypothetical protein
MNKVLSKKFLDVRHALLGTNAVVEIAAAKSNTAESTEDSLRETVISLDLIFDSSELKEKAGRSFVKTLHLLSKDTACNNLILSSYDVKEDESEIRNAES